jgi:glutamine cyclotransferase
MRLLIFLAVVSVVFACNNPSSQQDPAAGNSAPPGIPEPKPIGYQLINAYPHDTAAFTQGFELYRGVLVEGTGLVGRSSVRRVDLKTGKVLQRKDIGQPFFGEGITVLRDTLYQLTWENKTVFVYHAKTLEPIRQMSWSGQGWGLTNDGNALYISDGSDKIYVVRPSDLKLLRVISVADHMGPVNNLNELEWVNGKLLANRWQYDYIVQIDPSSGHVTGRIDFTDFLARNAKADLGYLRAPGSTGEQMGAVLNGIALDSATGHLLITGKLWPHVFEIKLNP